MRSWKITATWAGALALVGAITVAVHAAPKKDDAKEKELAEFRKGWNDANYLKKRDAISLLPTGYELGVPSTIEVMKSEEWLFRAMAIQEKILNETDAGTLDALAAFALETPKSIPDKKIAGGVQENVLFALLQNKNWATSENWARALQMARDGSKKAQPMKVRIRAVREAGRWRDDQPQAKADVAALIEILRDLDALKKPTKDELLLKWHVGDALESLTGEEHGDEIKAWDIWWGNNKDRDLTPRRATKLAKETVEDVDIEGHSFVRKKPRQVENFEVLFLSDFGRSSQYWEPYAFELNKMFSCTFVDLPDASKVKGLKRPQDRNGNEVSNQYFYPLPQLVDAFDARREASGQRKVGLVAHAVNAWVAMEYARRKPDSLAFIVIISTWAGSGEGKSFRKAIEQMRGNKNSVIRYFGEAHLNSPPGSREGTGSMDEQQNLFARIGGEKYMAADPYSVDMLLYGMDQGYHARQGQGQIALAPSDFDFKFDSRLGALKVPALIIWGAQDWMFVKEDQKVISQAFAKPTVSIYENAARTPWAEDPLRFFDEIRALIDASGIAKEDNKKKK
ncbi:MAG: hypothetical protein BroJett014_04990 [Planctomycetota bacterium]|nr:MAG: hypothetical protein BroJett014_04990 [Planctomycetota bacterium]